MTKGGKEEGGDKSSSGCVGITTPEEGGRGIFPSPLTLLTLLHLPRRCGMAAVRYVRVPCRLDSPHG